VAGVSSDVSLLNHPSIVEIYEGNLLLLMGNRGNKPLRRTVLKQMAGELGGGVGGGGVDVNDREDMMDQVEKKPSKSKVAHSDRRVADDPTDLFTVNLQPLSRSCQACIALMMRM
jgi:hypothetical protein